MCIIIIVQLVGAMRTKKSSKLSVLASVDWVNCVPWLHLRHLLWHSQQQQQVKLGSLKDTLKCIIPNIYLYAAKVNKDLSRTFGWLNEKLKEEKQSCPRTLLYCKTTKECGQLFSFFRNELKDVYINSEQDSRNMVIGMFHHNTLTKHKDWVTSSLYEPSGICRVVLPPMHLGWE